MIKTRGVAHFSIPVSDVERSKAIYADTLGMDIVFPAVADGMVFLYSGGDCIILVQTERPIATAGEVNVHHAFVVDHDAYVSAKATLERAGVKILFEEERQGGVVNGPRFYFEDPDGNVLELIDLTSYKGAAA